MPTRISRNELAARIAGDITEGSYVNLGIGAPTLVSNYLPTDQEIILHTENGMLGMGSEPAPGQIDPDLINAGKIPLTEIPGAAYFQRADSFAMMRGGHLDVCVLGAFQVAQNGDLANWSTGAPGAIPAVGGAIDLAIGAKQVYVMTDLLTRDGAPKLVTRCGYPLTGSAASPVSTPTTPSSISPKPASSFESLSATTPSRCSATSSVSN